MKSKKSYTLFKKATAIFLMMTLLWLTVSTPFVLSVQQKLAKQQKAFSINSSASDNQNENSDENGSNSVEEKTPVSSNLSEEFLHAHHATHIFFTVVSLYHKLENAGTYIAFHGELLVPPPNVA
ncbi:hypothetical protein QWZ08_21840 [Ferruginibacter paludis]|uniref:hypothetical protein n=1 Tax=Ferruginibacter paludis TaxID=1310417 RepID=UPI0025B41842|nr:hypothetical protein [Ferruginibacter paludis]MDN3658311.1 hypothetical protein [Ferruginibacter paludis]